jgi:hypothetical protein
MRREADCKTLEVGRETKKTHSGVCVGADCMAVVCQDPLIPPALLQVEVPAVRPRVPVLAPPCSLLTDRTASRSEPWRPC